MLDDIRDFLVANPDEVVVIVNQDYVTPADFVGAVRDADLEDHVYRAPVGEGGLTLREMIDRDQRLRPARREPRRRRALVPARVRGDPAGDAVLVRRGRGDHRVRRELPASCRPNRGPASAPLFLLNHWITTDPLPRPSTAALVNAFEPLLARARECERARGQLPNLVAVDFYRRGDVFRVVDRLNEVG